MTENQTEDLGPEIASVLTNMASTFKNDRHQSEAFRRMEASENIGQVIRQLNSAVGYAIMDACDILQDKFGLDGSHELYNYLFTVPYRWKLYEEAYRAETHVGCVDRTVTRIAHEVRAAGGQEAPAPRRDPRFQVAALAKDSTGKGIGEAAATDALILADQFDDARRIQRLSSDTRTITARIADGAAGVSEEQLRGLVRLVLGTAATIAREQDGLEV
ncbi:hypothetical protein GCM10023063_17950 [Arthrobacter methylotrophus]|uniref:Uncharacterized protein n=1 Tax=Arthrobacter methylotrophus TaxID=121291 RepID=A0ABV5URF7_9MICC